MRVLFLFLLMFLTGALASGQPEINVESIKNKYSKYNAVIAKQEVSYIFDIVKDSLQVRQHCSEEVLYLNNNTKAFTNDNIYYGTFSYVEDIDAYTLVPDGKGYEKIKVTHFNEANNRDGSIFYDDSKTIHFAYPSITGGAITSLNYSVIYQNPRFINRCFFQSFIPVVNSKVIVRVNNDIRLGYKLFNDNEIDIEFKQYSKGKYYYYVWEVTDVKPYKYLSTDYYNVQHFSPHLALYIEEVKIEDKISRFYSTVDDLYRFEYEMISGMKDTSSVELKALVGEITYGLNDREKAKAIYYWVQDNIKYVAYSDGYLGFIPAPAVEVFAKRFGDCKGMTSLINKMMDMAGLPAYFSWVGTRSIPYTYEELPLPSVDDHMVAAFREGDTTLIMDGTFKHLDFGVFPYHIQGKEVLISIGPDSYSIFKVPVSPSSSSTVYDSVTIVLSGQKISGKGMRVHTGFNKTELAVAMDGVKETDYQKRFSALFQKGNNKFRVDTSQVVNLFEREKPAAVLYSFSLDDYAKFLDKEIYINLNLDKSLQNSKIDTTGLYSLVTNDFHYTEKFITRFEIPEGYEIISVPESNSFGNGDFSVSFKYFLEDNTVTLEKEMKYDFLIIPEYKIAEWNNTIDCLNNNYRLSLVLRKTSSN